MTTMNTARPMAVSGLGRDRTTDLAAVAAAIAFGALGLVGIALAMAFPLSLGVVAEQQTALSAADVALAERIAGASWILAVAGALHLVAMFAVLDRGIWGKRIALVLAGAGAAGAAAAQVALVASGAALGEGAEIANGVALAYAVVVVAVVLIRPREEAR